MNTPGTHRPDHPASTAASPPPAHPAAPPPRLPGWARVLLTIVLMLPCAVAGVVLLLVPGYFDLLTSSAATVRVAAFAPSAVVVLAAYLLVSWALLRWVDRRPVGALGLRPDRRALLGLVTGCGIALLLGVVATGAVQALGLAGPTGSAAPDGPAQEVGAATVLAMVLFVLLRAFVLQGIGEEVLFRGYLMQSLRRRPVLAVLVAALAFTIPHLLSDGGQTNALERLLYLAIPAGFALSAGFWAVAMRSVWAAIGIHGGFHLATVVAALLGLRADGPAVWVAVGLAHAVAAVVIALLIPRRRWAEVRRHGPYARPATADGGDRRDG